MNRSALLWFLVLASMTAGAQIHIDSLEQELKKDISDSLKIEIHLQLSQAFTYVDLVKSQHYIKEAVDLSEKKKWDWAKAKSYTQLSCYYTLLGDYSTALRYDNLALHSSVAAKDTVHISKAYNNVGNDYHDIGEYDEAYFYLTQSFTLARAVGDSLLMAISLHNVGRVFKELGQHSRALDYLKLSLKISKKINDIEAESYYYHEAGDLQLRSGDYDSALISLLHALKLAREQHLLALVPKTMARIASVYLQGDDYETPLAYYDSAYLLHQKTGNRFGLAEVELGRGKVFFETKEFSTAQQYVERSLAMAQGLNARLLAIQCYQNLYSIWEQKGEYDKALNYFKQYKALEDSLFSQEMQQKLYRDQIRFETESRDFQIAALSQTDARQKDALKREEFIRNILVVVFALSVILLVTVYRSGQRRKQINHLLLKHQEETERRSEELQRLNQVKDKFFSIISHDLRSPINALSGILDLMAKGALTQEDFEEQTRELRMRFNHTRTLLNNLLDWTLLQMDKLSLQPARIYLQKIVDDNIQLLTSLNSKKIDLINEVPQKAVGFADSNTINLVIRNLMTNAIKFTNDGGKVTISASEQEQTWLLKVHDNGIGIKPEVQKILFDKTSPYTTRGTANEKGTGLGLILCKEFIEKNNGRIWVESDEGKGSTFWFTIPKPGLK